MSFAGDSAVQVPPISRKAFGCMAGLAMVVLLVIAFGASLVRLYTDWLWFAHDAQTPQVFALGLRMRVLGFLLSFAVAFPVVFFSVRHALSLTMVYARIPTTAAQVLIADAILWIERRTKKFAIGFAVVVSTLFALGASGSWPAWLLFTHAESFGVTDPVYGLDLSFFVFRLPFWIALVGHLVGLLVMTLAVTVLVYLVIRGLTGLASAEVSGAAIVRHLGLLIGLLIVAIGVRMWLGRYEVGFFPGDQFTGAGFAATWGVRAQQWLGILNVAYGLAVVAITARFGRGRDSSLHPLIKGLIALVILHFAGLAILPSALQSLYVGPNKISVEGPYAGYAIKMTRFGYGLDRIDVRNFDVRPEPRRDELEQNRRTIETMRLWDPSVLQRSIEGLQGLRPYYTFHDVDVDRYPNPEGNAQIAMVSPRDVNINGLSESARAWVNTRLQYTHGFGVVIAAADRAAAGGRPSYLVQDIPPRPEGWVEQPRIYFSDQRDAFGLPTDEYAIVGTKLDEFDYPTETGSATYRWTANRGTPVGSGLARLAFSLLLGDGNLMISPNITGESRVLVRRNVLERAAAIYPFLRFDSDPYLVAFQGRLIWILDGYTTSNHMPYSARTGRGSRGLGYIRNSVKVTIDAYSGEATAYAVEPDEPILKAFRRIYPDLVKDLTEAPNGLRRHFRYPEDLFMLQAQVLTTYHVTQPQAFLNNEDAWEMPKERGQTGDSEPMRAYYVLAQLPGSPEPEFLLILPFTPREKPNMIGWLAARCDPEQYGGQVLYRFPTGSTMPGPAQMESIFNQDQTIAQINRELNNEQSRIIPGNLLVLPLGGSVLYVKPLFLASRSVGIQAIPELRKVILALQSRVVVADTYAEALERLFAGAAPSLTPEQVLEEEGASPAAAPDQAAKIREAARLLDEADAALRSGDFTRYGELQKSARKLIQELAGG